MFQRHCTINAIALLCSIPTTIQYSTNTDYYAVFEFRTKTGNYYMVKLASIAFRAPATCRKSLNEMYL